MKIIYILTIATLMFGACVPTSKLIYLQATDDKTAVSGSANVVKTETEEYQLQRNDVIDVTMKTTSPELNAILQVDDNQNQIRNLGGLTSGDAFFLNGYALDDQGVVDLPLVGEIKLIGLTTRQAKQVIESKLAAFVKEGNYYVRIRLGGVRYSAIGEFVRPGKYTILQNRVTIFDAIANAGDMTSAAKRTEILLVRQYADGTKTHRINLLSDKIMESDFYFLKPNDMIYAKPMKVKQLGTGITFAQSLQLALSVITVAFLISNATN